MRFVLVLYHWCRVAYYQAAVLHLLQTDPLHDDLPWLSDQMIQSQAIVDAWVYGRREA